MILIINKSDTTGGAAVVSRRLLDAFRSQGIEARMLVVEKLSGDSDVLLASSAARYRLPFMLERLRVARINGFDRKSLFKFDLGSDGLPLASHPEVLKADAILLNWVNQGMLSLREIGKIMDLGKPVLWTLHDMWPFTAICHHSGECVNYREQCFPCPLLPAGGGRAKKVLSRVMDLKRRVYAHPNLGFVAVSSWLADRARSSSLLRDKPLFTIPNSFPIPAEMPERDAPSGHPVTLLFGAARLDDPIKNLPLLIEGLNLYLSLHPEMEGRIRLLTFGSLRNPDALASLRFPHTDLGILPPSALPALYAGADIVISTSLYESLPGTLVEGQAYGAIPLATDRGGQRDIIDDKKTGCLIPFGKSTEETAASMVKGLEWCVDLVSDPDRYRQVRRAMYESVKERFDPASVVRRYMQALNDIP